MARLTGEQFAHHTPKPSSEELVPEHILTAWNLEDFRRNPVPYPAPAGERVADRETELEDLVHKAVQLLGDGEPSELQRDWLERARAVLE
jgi:hypothetical protein